MVLFVSNGNFAIFNSVKVWCNHLFFGRMLQKLYNTEMLCSSIIEEYSIKFTFIS